MEQFKPTVDELLDLKFTIEDGFSIDNIVSVSQHYRFQGSKYSNRNSILISESLERFYVLGDGKNFIRFYPQNLDDIKSVMNLFT